MLESENKIPCNYPVNKGLLLLAVPARFQLSNFLGDINAITDFMDLERSLTLESQLQWNTL
jgi:hypothetical protein